MLHVWALPFTKWQYSNSMLPKVAGRDLLLGSKTGSFPLKGNGLVQGVLTVPWAPRGLCPYPQTWGMRWLWGGSGRPPLQASPLFKIASLYKSTLPIFMQKFHYSNTLSGLYQKYRTLHIWCVSLQLILRQIQLDLAWLSCNFLS